MKATVIATYATHAVIYHDLTDEAYLAETVAAVRAETHISVEIVREAESLEGA